MDCVSLWCRGASDKCGYVDRGLSQGCHTQKEMVATDIQTKLHGKLFASVKAGGYYCDMLLVSWLLRFVRSGGSRRHEGSRLNPNPGLCPSYDSRFDGHAGSAGGLPGFSRCELQ